MNDIVFSDPPATRPVGRTPIVNRLVSLHERPGEWARVFSAPSLYAARVQATRIKKGNYAQMGPGEYEAVGAIDEDGQAYVWVRWLGPQEDR